MGLHPHNRPPRRAPGKRGRAAIRGPAVEAHRRKELQAAAQAFPALHRLHEVHEVNRCFIELLQHSARTDRPAVHPLVAELREILLRMTPESRARAARRPFLLVDMEFDNGTYWRQVQNPTRSESSPERRGMFPRAGAVHLARVALTLAWHSVRADPHAARVCLGMRAPVSDIMGRLSLTDIARIAERRFHDVRPRWEDRPDLWRKLLLAARSSDFRRTLYVNLRGLQLVGGPVVKPNKGR